MQLILLPVLRKTWKVGDGWSGIGVSKPDVPETVQAFLRKGNILLCI